MNEIELEEFYELQKYIELCSMGDRPMSPSAIKLERYFELKDKFYVQECQSADIGSKGNC